MRESVRVTVLPPEPRDEVTAATDAVGILGIFFPQISERFHLAYPNAMVSASNDRSTINILTNLLGLVEGFEGPMAITAAFNDLFDWVAHNSTPGPTKVGEFTTMDPTLSIPVQDGGCLAAGIGAC